MKIKKSDSIVSVRNLKFSYVTSTPHNKNADILDIDSIDIYSGGCHAVLGPNGCGKTTLLKLISGLLKPVEGSVDTQSRAVLVHQHPYLLSGSVFSNVAYGLKVKKMSKDQIADKVNNELERWNLGHLAGRPSAKLSGGEKQRTAIARAMVLKPDILLLDEPTASVDPDNISQMETLITGIIATGTTVILSTHHIDFAYRISDTILRLRKGKPVESDENIVSGFIKERSESLNHFISEGTTLFCPGRDGDFRRAVFSMNDIILSAEYIKSSARNVFKAVIISVDMNSDDVIVGMKAGFTFKARISRESANELGLKPGREIFAILKSSSISLY